MGKRGILKGFASALAELAGVATVNVGFWHIGFIPGLFATGISLVAVGIAIDPPTRTVKTVVNEVEAL